MDGINPRTGHVQTSWSDDPLPNFGFFVMCSGMSESRHFKFALEIATRQYYREHDKKSP